MFKYEEPEMEILWIDTEVLVAVSNGGFITDEDDEDDTPYVPGTVSF